MEGEAADPTAGDPSPLPMPKKENILMVLGVLVILVEVVNAEILGRTFHYEFLVLGAALCGVSITQWSEKK